MFVYSLWVVGMPRNELDLRQRSKLFGSTILDRKRIYANSRSYPNLNSTNPNPNFNPIPNPNPYNPKA